MEGDNMSLENDLLAAADELEKTAMEMENSVNMEDSEKKECSKEEPKVEEKKVSNPEEKAKKEDMDDSKDSEKVAALKEELGISDDNLAEKVASADPSVVEYIKNLNQVPVESMGGEDTREKTAAELGEIDPFEEFLSTPL